MVSARKAIAGAVLVALVAGLGGFWIGHGGLGAAGMAQPLLSRLGIPERSPQPAREQAVAPQDWRQLDLVKGYLKSRFVDGVRDEDLVRGAIRGMVEATGDKYSVYMSPEQYTTFLNHFNESFGGVGVQVEIKDNFVTVVRPIKGTPGERAGLRTGDRIIAVDGKDVTRVSLEEVVQLIRGPQGTSVKLTVSRDPHAERFDVTLVRATIPTPQMEGRMLSGGIGYIRIEEFNANVGRRVREKLIELRRQGMRGLILDLRQNPGGLLSEAVEVSSLFVGPGPVVHIVGRSGERETMESKGTGFDLPLVVLVDEGSASASEIVAGAVKDRNAGVLVGVKTFGKGSVQTYFDLEGGAGLKLTTARYLTAGGHSIHQKGITPDVEVQVPKGTRAELDNPSHPQVQKAVELITRQIAS